MDVLEASQAKQDFDEASTSQEPNADEGEGEKKDGDDEGKAGINADAADAIFRTCIELVRLGDKLHLTALRPWASWTLRRPSSPP